MSGGDHGRNDVPALSDVSVLSSPSFSREKSGDEVAGLIDPLDVVVIVRRVDGIDGERGLVRVSVPGALRHGEYALSAPFCHDCD